MDYDVGAWILSKVANLCLRKLDVLNKTPFIKQHARGIVVCQAVVIWKCTQTNIGKHDDFSNIPQVYVSSLLYKIVGFLIMMTICYACSGCLSRWYFSWIDCFVPLFHNGILPLSCLCCAILIFHFVWYLKFVRLLGLNKRFEIIVNIDTVMSYIC